MEVFCARGRGGVWWKSAFSRLVRRIFLLRIAVRYGGELENKNNNNGTSARVAAGWRTWWPISGGSECGRRSSRKRCDESFSFLFRVQKIILFKAKEKVCKISQLTLRLDGKTERAGRAHIDSCRRSAVGQRKTGWPQRTTAAVKKEVAVLLCEK